MHKNGLSPTVKVELEIAKSNDTFLISFKVLLHKIEMRIVILQIILLLLLRSVSLCHGKIGAEQSSSLSRPAQILYIKNHTSYLNLTELKILEADDIKNRNVVVVSMTGMLRTGRSFLLNFYLRYLNAQVNESIRFSFVL